MIFNVFTREKLIQSRLEDYIVDKKYINVKIFYIHIFLRIYVFLQRCRDIRNRII